MTILEKHLMHYFQKCPKMNYPTATHQTNLIDCGYQYKDGQKCALPRPHFLLRASRGTFSLYFLVTDSQEGIAALFFLSLLLWFFSDWKSSLRHYISLSFSLLAHQVDHQNQSLALLRHCLSCICIFWASTSSFAIFVFSCLQDRFLA